MAGPRRRGAQEGGIDGERRNALIGVRGGGGIGLGGGLGLGIGISGIGGGGWGGWGSWPRVVLGCRCQCRRRRLCRRRCHGGFSFIAPKARGEMIHRRSAAGT